MNTIKKYWSMVSILLAIVLLYLVGYAKVARCVMFFFLLSITGLNAYFLTNHFFHTCGKLEKTLVLWSIFSAQVVVTTLMVGAIGWLFPGTLMVFQFALLLGTILLLKPRLLNFQINLETRSILKFIYENHVTLFLFTFLACIATVHIIKGLYYPPFEWDSLTYHLFFPAKWLETHSISVVPTPFTDNAASYYPSNGSVLMLWYMIPFNGDVVVDLVQFPAFLAMLLAVYGITIQLNISKQYAWIPVFLVGLNPMVFHEISTAMVDILLSSYAAICVYFLLSFHSSNNKSLIVIASLNLGLFLGTKYSAIPFSIPILFLYLLILGNYFLKQGLKNKNFLITNILYAIPVLLTGSYFYLRNLVLTGNPLYPLDITVGSCKIFEGAFSSSAMNNYVYHVSGWRQFLKMCLTLLNPVHLPIVIVSLVITPIYLAKQRDSFILILVSWMGVGYLLVHWYIIPQNNVYRFSIISITFFYFSVGFLMDWLRNDKWKLVRNLIAFTLLFGIVYQVLLKRVALFNHDLETILATLLLFFMLRFMKKFLPGTVTLNHGLIIIVLIIFIGLTSISWNMYDNNKYMYYKESNMGSGYLGMEQGWDWLNRNTTGQTIAYTGNNIPYPLFGTGLKNRVVYINVNKNRTWKFHDYQQALDKVIVKGNKNQAYPIYARMETDRDAWLSNCLAEKIDYLFISALHPWDYRIPHDPEGFVVEDQWARELSTYFEPVYITERVHIYKMNH